MFTFTIFALGAEDCEVNINIILNIVCIYPACLHKLFARNRNIFFYVLLVLSIDTKYLSI